MWGGEYRRRRVAERLYAREGGGEGEEKAAIEKNPSPRLQGAGCGGADCVR